MTDAKHISLFGTVSWSGYTILGMRADGTSDELYAAGNSPSCSVTILDYDHAARLSSETLIKYCNVCGKEMAKELGVEFKGVDEVEEDS